MQPTNTAKLPALFQRSSIFSLRINLLDAILAETLVRIPYSWSFVLCSFQDRVIPLWSFSLFLCNIHQYVSWVSQSVSSCLHHTTTQNPQLWKILYSLYFQMNWMPILHVICGKYSRQELGGLLSLFMYFKSILLGIWNCRPLLFDDHVLSWPNSLNLLGWMSSFQFCYR